MSKKLKRIMAIIALVLVGLFTVSFVAFLVDRTLFNGAIGFFALFTGGFGFALFLVVRLSRDNTEKADDDVESRDDKDSAQLSATEVKEDKKDSENSGK